MSVISTVCLDFAFTKRTYEQYFHELDGSNSFTSLTQQSGCHCSTHHSIWITKENNRRISFLSELFIKVSTSFFGPLYVAIKSTVMIYFYWPTLKLKLIWFPQQKFDFFALAFGLLPKISSETYRSSWFLHLLFIVVIFTKLTQLLWFLVPRNDN